MKRNIRYVSTMIAALSMVILIGGCGKQEPETNQQTSSQSVEREASADVSTDSADPASEAPTDSPSSEEKPLYQESYDLRYLVLEGERTIDSIRLQIDGKEYILNSNTSPEALQEALGEAEIPYANMYRYGDMISFGEYPLSFSFSKRNRGDETVILPDYIKVAFSETSDVSLSGITANSTTEEIVAILGTPDEIGSMARDTNRREQSMYWGECELDGQPIKQISVTYNKGILEGMHIYFNY